MGEISQLVYSCKNDVETATKSTVNIGVLLQSIEKNVKMLYKLFTVDTYKNPCAEGILNAMLAAIQSIDKEKQHLSSLTSMIDTKQDFILTAVRENGVIDEIKIKKPTAEDQHIDGLKKFETKESCNNAKCNKLKHSNNHDTNQVHDQNEKSGSEVGVDGRCTDGLKLETLEDFKDDAAMKEENSELEATDLYEEPAGEDWIEDGDEEATPNNCEYVDIGKIKSNTLKPCFVRLKDCVLGARVKKEVHLPQCTQDFDSKDTDNIIPNNVKNENEITREDHSIQDSSDTKDRFKCTICSKVFKHTHMFRLNSLCKMRFARNPVCDCCKRKGNWKKDLEYPCVICDLVFTNRLEYRRHKRRHQYQRVKLRNINCTCDLCIKEKGDSRNFSCKKSLENHKKIVHGPKDTTKIKDVKPKELFHCDKCDKSFLYKKSFTQHTSYHLQENQACSFCGKQFRNKAILKKHVDNVHFKKEKQSQVCPMCGVLYKNAQHLEMHMAMHREEKSISCHLCDKTFYHTLQLKNHIKTHNPQFFCEECGKGFALNSNLKIHLLSHRQDRRYPCQYCSKRFFTTPARKVHEKIHTGEKNFTCSYCSKSFIESTKLKRHVRIHTGEKPYGCEFCDAKFNQSSSRNTHVKKHHGVEVKVKKIYAKRTDFSRNVAVRAGTEQGMLF